MSALHFDPRTKLALLLLCVLCAMFSPNLCYQFALVVLIGFFAASCGKVRYALRGIIAYALICVFTVWCMGVMSGTWRTMFVAFLGLLHKVYACGMLAGVIIGTTRVNEFLSAMERLHCPKKLTIVGPSGGGKTTLCHLLSRFWDVDEGSVSLGGHDVREYSMAA